MVQALLIEVEGSAPLPEGAMMVIDEHGHIEGSITGGCVEGAVVTEAEELLSAGGGAKLLRYGISRRAGGHRRADVRRDRPHPQARARR